MGGLLGNSDKHVDVVSKEHYKWNYERSAWQRSSAMSLDEVSSIAWERFRELITERYKERVLEYLKSGEVKDE
jgi:hypothetical protein